MKTLGTLTMSLTLLLGASSCYSLHHEVGAGAQGGATETNRQWYVLWGLVPLGHVDSKAMAQGAADYTIKTEHGFVDILLNLVTGIVTVYSQTVTVER